MGKKFALAVVSLFILAALFTTWLAVDAAGGASLYLPVLFAPGRPLAQRPLSGRVTFSGGPAANVPLTLFNKTAGGISQRIYATTTTGSDGTYTFPDTPTLASGEYFFVYYSLERTGALLYFMCREVRTMAASYTCNFDITDITPTAPPYGARVSLPYTFTWTKLFATDVYFWELFRENGPILERVTYSTPLNGTSSYELTTVPDLDSGESYMWSVTIIRPEGSGHSQFYPRVMFDAPGSPLADHATSDSSVPDPRSK